jgi:adenylate kinase family enzyme
MERIKTRGKTSRREDDQDPKIAEKRLDQYKRETLPLVDFYKEMGKLVSIDGEKSPSDVMKQIDNVLNLWK